MVKQILLVRRCENLSALVGRKVNEIAHNVLPLSAPHKVQKQLSENIDTLPLGEQLRVMRLRTGLTIEQAARAIGVPRRRVMNYELGKVKHMKAEVVSKLIELYKNGK